MQSRPFRSPTSSRSKNHLLHRQKILLLSANYITWKAYIESVIRGLGSPAILEILVVFVVPFSTRNHLYTLRDTRTKTLTARAAGSAAVDVSVIATRERRCGRRTRQSGAVNSFRTREGGFYQACGQTIPG